MTTPVLFLVFNRPDTTKVVFDAIRQYQPSKLYIAADGPRKQKAGEEALCLEVRNIVSAIDWLCDVKTLYRKENLGCKVAVSSAIDWFFEQEEEGIILEDDCLPHPDFFNYCSELLNRFRTQPEIMHIGGANFQKGNVRGDGSYYFSRYNHIWGWATWRRAWNAYDVDMKEYSAESTLLMLDEFFHTKKEIKFWVKVFDNVIHGVYNTWDYQWTYAVWRMSGISIIPNVNLVSNIGFGSGTHTQAADFLGLSNMKVGKLPTISHPKKIIIDKNADKFGLDHYFAPHKIRLYASKLKSLIT